MFATKTTRRRTTAIAASTALIAAGIVGLTGSAAQAAGTYTASPATGAHAATTIVGVTGKDFKTAGGTSKVAAAGTGVKIATSCGTSAGTATGIMQASPAFTVVSATRIVATVTDTGNATDAKSDLKICVYAVAAGNGLLGSANFSAYPVPTVTGVTPSSGPTTGGQTIAIDGTNFTSKSTVKVNGVAATGVKFVDSTSLTAVTPATTGAAVQVEVTTEGGKSADVAGDNYTYVNAIKVSPASGWYWSATQVTSITITGSGFNTTNLPSAANSGVIFLRSGAAIDCTVAAEKLAYVPQSSLTVVSDTEIVLDVPAAIATAAKTGAYNLVVVKDNTAANCGAWTTVNSASSTFTVAPY